MRHFIYTPRSGSKIIYSRPGGGVVRADLQNGSHIVYCPLPPLQVAAQGKLRMIVARLLNRLSPPATIAADIQGDIQIYTNNPSLLALMKETCVRQMNNIPELKRVYDALPEWEEMMYLLDQHVPAPAKEAYSLHPFLTHKGGNAYRIVKGTQLVGVESGIEETDGETAAWSQALRNQRIDHEIWFEMREMLASEPSEPDLEFFLARTPILVPFAAQRGEGGEKALISTNADWHAFVVQQSEHPIGFELWAMAKQWAEATFAVSGLDFYDNEASELDPFNTRSEDDDEIAQRGKEINDRLFFTWAQAHAHVVPRITLDDDEEVVNWGKVQDAHSALSFAGGDMTGALRVLEQKRIIPPRAEYEHYFAPHFPAYVAPTEEAPTEEAHTEVAPTEEKKNKPHAEALGVAQLPCESDGSMEEVARLTLEEAEVLFWSHKEEIVKLSKVAPFPPHAGTGGCRLAQQSSGCWEIEEGFDALKTPSQYDPLFIPAEKLPAHVQHLRMLRQMAEVMRSQQQG